MSMINIDELHKPRKLKLEQRKKVFESILKCCHNRIKMVAETETNLSYCFYKVPRYIYGIPLYDINNCIVYLFNSLVKNGFEVKYIEPNTLYISWLDKTNPKEHEKPKIENKKSKDYKSLEFKPSNDFIYDMKSFDLFEKKKNKYLI